MDEEEEEEDEGPAATSISGESPSTSTNADMVGMRWDGSWLGEKSNNLARKMFMVLIFQHARLATMWPLKMKEVKGKNANIKKIIY